MIQVQHSILSHTELETKIKTTGDFYTSFSIQIA